MLSLSVHVKVSTGVTGLLACSPEKGRTEYDSFIINPKVSTTRENFEDDGGKGGGEVPCFSSFSFFFLIHLIFRPRNTSTR